MIGIVIVSHSAQLADGVRQLAEQMTGGAVRISVAGGIDDPENPIGTDPIRVMEAITEVYDEDGVVVLMDLGSALMSAETALDFLDPDWLPRIHLCDAPLIEGAVAAAVQASIGGDAASVMREARMALASKQQHLGTASTTPDSAITEAADDADAQTLDVVVPNANGIHARPAARIVQLSAAHPAQLSISHGDIHVSGSSISQVALLGARQGDTITFCASGEGASALLAALQALVDDNFGDRDNGHQPAEKAAHTASTDDLPAGVIGGVSASEGLALGQVVRFDALIPAVIRTSVSDTQAEQKRLRDALQQATAALQGLAEQTRKSIGSSEAAIFEAHVLMLADPDIQQPALARIEQDAVNAEYAWWQTVETLAEAYRQSQSALMQERAGDVIDAGAWVLRSLSPDKAQSRSLPDDAVIVAADLTPSDTAMLDPTRVCGIVTAQGGATSHTAIIARSLSIPAVVGAGQAATKLQNGQEIIVDGDKGWVYTAPDAEQISQTRQRIADREAARQALIEASHQPAITQDGHAIEVAANIGKAADADRLARVGADGVGLFRTELLFMSRASAPTEDEQVAAYRAAAQCLDGKPIIIRTLDVGGDKQIDYIHIDPEENPFLGYRGIRYWMGDAELARTQLRAICRASAEHDIRVMFPMVSTLDEWGAARQLLDAVQDELAASGVDYNPDMPAGIMIEVPAAVMIADQLAQHVDFVSIGTNDLTQYIMAADRGNARVTGLATPFQPGVLRAIRTVVDAMHAHDKWVGICGEMAGNPLATALLIGLGLDELSMSAPSIPRVKAIIRELSQADAAELARQVLLMDSADAITAHLQAQMS